jgi:hypothetical protein
MWLKVKKNHKYDKIMLKIYLKILRLKKWFEFNLHEQIFMSYA